MYMQVRMIEWVWFPIGAWMLQVSSNASLFKTFNRQIEYYTRTTRSTLPYPLIHSFTISGITSTYYSSLKNN